MADKESPVVVEESAPARACGEGESDVQLLERFRTEHDQSAFDTLLQKHGPVVLGVCRRVLGNSHDAEDAFQATFLTLIRKAGTISRGDLLAHWLYAVAYRTALKAKTAAWLRRLKERKVGEMAVTEPSADKMWSDLEPVLDEELHRLPHKYRVALVSCYFHGKTKAEAAREMGCPEGTVSGRLARARDMLRKRLAKRGFAVSLGMLLLLLGEKATAAVPDALLKTTATTAVSFAAGRSALISPSVLSLTESASRPLSLGALMAITLLALALIGASGAIGYNYMSSDGAEHPTDQPAIETAPLLKPSEPGMDMSADLPAIPKNPASMPNVQVAEPAPK